ncbi:MAG: ribosome silencing factor [Rhodobiaceae bacterium]|jgi:ribosome-associated protein|nr:ribosomal silencing factor RsfS [Rhodobiaceae bacterium]MCR9243076.1 ribosome silencing factor [Rhodobiaceae bacterium]
MDSSVQSQSPAGSKAPTSAGEKSTQAQSNAMLDLVLTCLDDDKAEEIVSINLEGKSAIADHMVVASGRSQRHVGALADHLTRRMKEEGLGNARVEGLQQSDWVLIDGGDVIIHIFRPEVREFYKLEKMWSADVTAERIAIS